MTKHRVVGVDFSHMHMGDLLRQVCDHPDAEVVGAVHDDPEEPRQVLGRLGLSDSLIYEDWERCVEATRPTVVVLCAPPAKHCEWALRIAERGLHLLVEKPFAVSVEEADRMIGAFEASGKKLAVNWPLAWYPVHRAAKKLLDDGLIGPLVNLHYYDGNRGPLFHAMDKIELETVNDVASKQRSWFYQREHGGGSLLDYLGYGATLATWFNGGETPLEVTAVVDEPAGLEVDEHSVTIARYASGLSKFETRWGTFTDPWTHQPAPKCGFVLCGAEGTISSYDFEDSVWVQTRERPEGYAVPVESVGVADSDPITYFLGCVEEDREIEGPLAPGVGRVGQRIVDAAARSAAKKQTERL